MQTADMQTCAQTCRPVADMQHADMQRYRTALARSATPDAEKKSFIKSQKQWVTNFSVDLLPSPLAAGQT